MRMLSDLSSRVQTMEEHQKQQAASPTASRSTSHSIRRRTTRHQPTPIPELELTEEVRQSMVKRMREVPPFTSPTTDEDSMSEEEQPAPCRHEPLKSGMQHMGASMVVKKITWLHEVVYSVDGKPPGYEDLTIPMFVQECLITMKGEGEPSRIRWLPILKN